MNIKDLRTGKVKLSKKKRGKATMNKLYKKLNKKYGVEHDKAKN